MQSKTRICYERQFVFQLALAYLCSNRLSIPSHAVMGGHPSRINRHISEGSRDLEINFIGVTWAVLNDGMQGQGLQQTPCHLFDAKKLTHCHL